MTLTGISLQEVSSGGAGAPKGQEFKQAYFSEHTSMTGMYTISAATDIEAVFGTDAGDAELRAELETAQANADSNFFAVVHLSAPLTLIATNVDTVIEDVASNHEVSTLVFVVDADGTFAEAVKTELAVQLNQKRYFEAILRFRKASAETPSVYAAAFDTEFSSFSSSAVSIVAPTTQDNWLGAYAGRLARIAVQASAGKVIDGGLVGVDTDATYGYDTMTSLDSHRAVFFKRFVEDPSAVHVNDDVVMFSQTDSVTTMAQRRVVNKAKREILYHAFSLINNETYNEDASGSLAASLVAAKGLEVMKTPLPGKSPEISDYTLETSWITDGISIAFTLTDVNRIKIVDTTIELTN